MSLDDHLSPEVKGLMQRAKTELAQKNWHDASDSLIQLYESISTFDINYRLVTALFMDEQYQLASSYADDFLLNYLEDESDFRMIVALAIQNQNFVYAQQLAMLWHDDSVKQSVLSEIRLAEEEARENMATTFHTVGRQFYHLSDYSLSEQRERYESALHLPVAEFVKGAQYLLVDPYVTPIIRATLLEDLQKLNIADDITYRWLDDSLYTINLTQMPLLTDSKIFKEIADVLDENVGQDDPIAADMLAQQVRFELALLYPRLEEVIQDSTAWALASVDYYYDNANVSETTSQKRWHNEVRQLIQSFFGN